MFTTLTECLDLHSTLPESPSSSFVTDPEVGLPLPFKCRELASYWSATLISAGIMGELKGLLMMSLSAMLAFSRTLSAAESRTTFATVPRERFRTRLLVSVESSVSARMRTLAGQST